MAYRNKQEEICQPMQIKTSSRLLLNGGVSEVIPPEKKLQIVSQNKSHTSIVMPCSNSIIDELGNEFRIENPYDLICNETRMFGYISIWGADKSGKQDSQKERNHSVELKKYSRCGWCRNWCRVLVTCTPKEFVTMSRCFWKERLSGVSIYKNDELLTHYSVTLMVRPHLEAPYGFWRHTNDVIGKETVYLNTATNNFLEEINFNYSYIPLNTLGNYDLS
jgi:hypothetical protein